MKKLIALCLFTLILLLNMTSCSNIETYGEENCINLCDYRNIEIDKEYLSISSEEVNMIISMDFSSNDYYKVTDKKIVEMNDVVMLDIYSENDSFCYENIYYEVGSFDLSDDFDKQLLGKKANSKNIYSITVNEISIEIDVTLKGIYELGDATNEEDILNYYGYDSLAEVIEFIEKRAAEEILYNYMLNYVFENSKINYFPKSIENKITQYLNELNKQAASNKMSLDKFLEQSGTNTENVKNEIYNYYYEILVCEAVLNKENIAVTDNDIIEFVRKIAIENEIDENEVYNYYTEDDLYFQTLSYMTKKILISYAIII